MTADCHQIAAITDDYDTKKAYVESLGYEVVAESAAGGFRVAHIDTSADSGFYTGGAEPVRIMTRDGYRAPDDSEAGDDVRR
jgi:hypothetical protein